MTSWGTPTDHSISPDSGEHWSAPGAWPVVPGVHRIPLPLPTDGLKAVNVYVLQTPDGLTLIDAGWAIQVSRELLERSLAELGAGLGDIRRFLVTHVHRDHYTQAVTVRRDFGSTVALGAGERSTLDVILGHTEVPEDPHLPVLRRAGAEELVDRWQGFAQDKALELTHWGYPDEWIHGEQTFTVGERQLTAVPTPGHTAGHVVFADAAAELLFAGDHVLPTITPSIGVEPIETELPLRNFLRSLELVRRRPDAMLLPAHGPVAPSVHARVDQLLDHHDERLRLVQAAVIDGCTLGVEVAERLPWTRHGRSLRELDVFNACLGVQETMLHLDLLAAQGRIERIAGAPGGPDRFGAAANPVPATQAR